MRHRTFWSHDGWVKRRAYMNRRFTALHEQGRQCYWDNEAMGPRSLWHIKVNRIFRNIPTL